MECSRLTPTPWFRVQASQLLPLLTVPLKIATHQSEQPDTGTKSDLKINGTEQRPRKWTHASMPTDFWQVNINQYRHKVSSTFLAGEFDPCMHKYDPLTYVLHKNQLWMDQECGSTARYHQTARGKICDSLWEIDRGRLHANEPRSIGNQKRNKWDSFKLKSCGSAKEISSQHNGRICVWTV